MNYTVNLDDVINGLKNRWNDLRDQLDNLVDANVVELYQRRSELTKMLSDLDQEIIKQSTIRAARNAANVVIPAPSPDDVNQLTMALNTLNTSIKSDEAWDNVITMGTAVLNASATIRSQLP